MNSNKKPPFTRISTLTTPRSTPRILTPSTPVVGIENHRTLRVSGNGDPTPLLPGIPKIKMVGLPSTVNFIPYSIPGTLEKGKAYKKAIALPALNRGLVLLCHGSFASENGFDRENAYNVVLDYLAQCLASNGFIAVTIKHSPGSGSATARISFLTHIKHILEDPEGTFAAFSLKGRPVSFVGVSEGCGGAIQAAAEVKAGALGKLLSTVSSVVLMGPTFKSGGATNYTDSLLVLQGTHDGDSPAGGQSVKVYEQAVVKDKFLLWMHGGTHSGFLQDLLAISTDQLWANVTKHDQALDIERSTQNFVVRNYVTMFLLWKMAEQFQFSSVFTGDAGVEWVPPTAIIKGDLDIRFRAFPLYNRALSISLGASSVDFVTSDIFQEGTLVGPGNPLKVAPLKDLHPILRNHSDTGMLVQWILGARPNPRITLICDKTIMALSPKLVEFDAVLLGLSTLNASKPAAVEIRLKSGAIFSAPVTVLIEPSVNLDARFNDVNVTCSILSTIRIPVSKFGPLPPGFLATSDLRIDFAKSNLSGQVALANFRAAFSF